MNIVIISGNLARDPELRYTPDGVAVTNFAVAVNHPYNRDKVDFFECTAWRKTAEFVAKYLEKGRSVTIKGEIHFETYEDKGGNNRRSTKVTVDSIEPHGSGHANAKTASKEADEMEEVEIDEEELPF